MMNKRSRALWDDARRTDASYSALIRAILYELQPVRFSTLQVTPWLVQVRQCLGFIQLNTPRVTRSLLSFLKRRTLKQWLILFTLWLYWQLVKYIHRYVSVLHFSDVNIRYH